MRLLMPNIRKKITIDKCNNKTHKFGSFAEVVTLNYTGVRDKIKPEWKFNCNLHISFTGLINLANALETSKMRKKQNVKSSWSQQMFNPDIHRCDYQFWISAKKLR